jgi:hypothetical protein
VYPDTVNLFFGFFFGVNGSLMSESRLCATDNGVSTGNSVIEFGA